MLHFLAFLIELSRFLSLTSLILSSFVTLPFERPYHCCGWGCLRSRSTQRDGDISRWFFPDPFSLCALIQITAVRALIGPPPPPDVLNNVPGIEGEKRVVLLTGAQGGATDWGNSV